MKSVVVAAILVYSMLVRVAPLPDLSMPARVYYNSNLTYGTTSSIKYYLECMDYDVSLGANPSEANLLAAFGSNMVLHMLGHGSPGSHQIYYNGSVAGSLIANEVYAEYSDTSLSNLRLAFLEGCKTGASSSANGTYPDVLEDLGVDASISFEDVIEAVTATDGIYNFARQVYYYLYGGRTVQAAVYQARAVLYDAENWYAGSEYVVIRGGSTRIYSN